MFAASGQDIILASVGGLLLSVSTSLNLLIHGNITGMSGLIPGLVGLDKDNAHSKYSVFSGILLAGALFYKLTPDFFESPQVYTSNLSIYGFALGGLLVGLGTRLSNGCTSGHGVCGLARLSKRSLAAVCSFLFTAIIVASVMSGYQLLQSNGKIDLDFDSFRGSGLMIGIAVVLFLIVIGIYYQKKQSDTITIVRWDELFVSFLVGFIFASGLIVSGMIKRSKVIGFLNLANGLQVWDPSLMFVLGFAVLPNLLTFHFILQRTTPLMNIKFNCPTNTDIDAKLLGGASIFGIGWGITGVCPGPAFTAIPVLVPALAFIYIPALLLGHSIIPIIDKVKQQ